MEAQIIGYIDRMGGKDHSNLIVGSFTIHGKFSTIGMNFNFKKFHYCIFLTVHVSFGYINLAFTKEELLLPNYESLP